MSKLSEDPGLLRLADAVLVPGYAEAYVPDWLAEAIEGGLAGVCWFAQNLDGVDPAEASDLLRRHRTDLLVLSDEEGGAVSRIEPGGSSWPGNAALGQIDDVGLTERVAAAMAAGVRAAGIDVMLAPVVDVNSDPANPVIGVRSFGATADLVGRHGAAFVRGVQSQGIAACAKHFPGHGATRTDSHVTLPRVDDGLDVLRERDLAPFAAAVEAGVRTVMTAHILFPAVDTEPATMSPAWMRLLRAEVGFEGVVISDALDMKAISAGVGRGTGAVRALAAGVDLLCIGNPRFAEPYDAHDAWQEVRHSIATAIADGALAHTRLESAAARVAELATGLVSERCTATEAPLGVVDLARQAAWRSMQMVGDPRVGARVVLVVESAVNVAAGGDAAARLASGLSSELDGVSIVRAVRAAEAAAAATDALDHRRPVVLVTDGRSGPGHVQAVRAVDPDSVVVHIGPDGSLPDLAGPSIRTYGTGWTSIETAAALLTGRRG
ncbi:MAG: glycoside hydrolase family 3 [Actinomycetota bacterium]|nr:glycoside hydrolase family 3 [Actinomycetota bacterium]